MAQAASLWVKLGLVDKEFSDGLKRAENQMKRFGDRLSGLGSRLTVGLSAPLALASAGAIKLAANLEQTKIAFEVMTGSAKKAGDMVSNLQKMAAKTPYESGDLLKSAETLMLFGVEAEKVQGILGMLGDVASGNSEKLRALTLAFAQVQSTGRLTGQDLLQMVNAGFNPLQIISEKTGISMAQLKDSMSEGAISADMVTEAFRVATSEGGRFFGMMDKQSQTTLGKFSTFIDNAKLALTNLGNALLPFANKMMELLLPLTERLTDLSESFSKLPEPVKNITVITIAFAAALGPLLLIVGKLITSFSALVGVLKMLPLVNVIAGFSSISFSVQAMASGAATAGEALGFLAKSFTPFLKGGLIVAGLAVIVDFLGKMAENARIAKLEISQISTLTDAEKKRQSLQSEIKRLENRKKGASSSFNSGGWLADRGLSTWDNDDEARLLKLKEELKKLNDKSNSLKTTQTPEQKPNVPSISIPKFDFSLPKNETDSNLDNLHGLYKSLWERLFGMTAEEYEKEIYGFLNPETAEERSKKMYEALQGPADEYYKEQQEALDQWIKAYQEKMNQWSNAVNSIVESAAQGMEQSMSDFFFDAMTGKLDSLADYVTTFMQAIVREISNQLAKIATENIMSNGFGSWLTNLFGGGKAPVNNNTTQTSNYAGTFASGGYIPSGHWGITGERGPEVTYGGRTGVTVMPTANQAPNFVINNIDQGSNAEVKTETPYFDGSRWVVNQFLKAKKNNIGGLNTGLSGGRA